MNLQNRFWIFDDGLLIRKLASRIECEPYLQAGCTLTVLPKVKEPTPADLITRAHLLVGDALL